MRPERARGRLTGSLVALVIARYMRFMLTCGFWPLFDRDDLVCLVTVFDADRQIGSFEIRASRHEWTWTPLLPLSPLNFIWSRRATEVLASALPQLSAHLLAPHRQAHRAGGRTVVLRRAPPAMDLLVAHRRIFG
jgi:hypothetical protein